jgi:hypothetical protein
MKRIKSYQKLCYVIIYGRFLINVGLLFFFNFFWRIAPFGFLYFPYFSMNEPELGAGIDPGMAFNPFPSSILDKARQDLNPQPYRS